MIGITELALLGAMVLGAGMIVAGLVLRGRSRPASLPAGETPSVPPKRVTARASHTVVHLHAGAPLGDQLRTHANEAEIGGLRPFLEFGAVWCPPSRMFGDALEDPRMQAALAGVYLIRAEIDNFSNDPVARELGASVVPSFYELGADGHGTGRKIDGGAWGADTIENMSRTMTSFFAG